MDIPLFIPCLFYADLNTNKLLPNPMELLAVFWRKGNIGGRLLFSMVRFRVLRLIGFGF